MDKKIDSIEELFRIVQALGACSEIATEGLDYILEELKGRLYELAVDMDESED